MRVATRAAPGEAGFLTIQYLLAVGLTFLLLTQVTNLLVHAYARGAVRAALDEGVRAASVAEGLPGECVGRAEAVLADLLGGAMGAGVGAIACSVEGDRVRASVSATFPAWLPGVPATSIDVTAQVLRDQDDEA